MAKKRSCRRTVEEDRIHERAVKMRKMTDEQLVKLLEDAGSEGYSRGMKAGPEQAEAEMKRIAEAAVSVPHGKTTEAFVLWLKTAQVKGIGPATVNRLYEAAEANGYI